MKRRKHRIARIRPGVYNYRAYTIYHSLLVGDWFIETDDGGSYARSKSLRGMRRKIDRWERANARPSQT